MQHNKRKRSSRARLKVDALIQKIYEAPPAPAAPPTQPFGTSSQQEMTMNSARVEAPPAAPTPPTQPIGTSSQQEHVDSTEPAFVRVPSEEQGLNKDWTVDIIHENGLITQERMKAKNVWNLPRGKKVICQVNEFGQGLGAAGGLIGFWLGNMATDCELIPLNFCNWKEVPEQYFNDAVSLIESKIAFSERNGLKWAWRSLGEKRRDYRSKLSGIIKKLHVRDEIMKARPPKVPQDQWNSFVDYQLSDKCIEMCIQNQENRKKLKFPHTGGSKSNARRKNEMELKKGRPVNRAELFIATHIKKDGSYVNEDARATMEKVSEMLREQESLESYTGVVSSDDALGQVLGKEHSGRVRGLGLGPCPSQVFGLPKYRLNDLNFSSTSSAHSNEGSLQSELSSVKEELEALKKEREMEQARMKEKFEALEKEREMEKAQQYHMVKYLADHMGVTIPSVIVGEVPCPTTQAPDVGCAEASRRRSSGASHDP